MAESETLEVTLKKPMGLVLEENINGFGGLRVKEIKEGGAAQVGFSDEAFSQPGLMRAPAVAPFSLVSASIDSKR